MKKGVLYGVGVGPGDPELLTLKAARILREADVVAVPDKGRGERTALNIVRDAAAGKPLLYCPTPMVRDKELLDGCYEEITGRICALLDEGKNVAFITLGDPAIYSTYLYIHEKTAARGYDAEMIPGVPSFCAAAARLGRPLCEGAERLLIVPASYEGLEECLDFPAGKVFMKAGRALPALRDALADRGLLSGAAMAVNCGMEGERLYEDLTGLTGEEGYFSVVLVREGEGR